MKRLVNVVGILAAALGILWILQGTDIINSGAMAGHIQWAVIGALFVIIGAGLLVSGNRRQKSTTSTGSHS